MIEVARAARRLTLLATGLLCWACGQPYYTPDNDPLRQPPKDTKRLSATPSLWDTQDPEPPEDGTPPAAEPPTFTVSLQAAARIQLAPTTGPAPPKASDATAGIDSMFDVAGTTYATSQRCLSFTKACGSASACCREARHRVFRVTKDGLVPAFDLLFEGLGTRALQILGAGACGKRVLWLGHYRAEAGPRDIALLADLEGDRLANLRAIVLEAPAGTRADTLALAGVAGADPSCTRFYLFGEDGERKVGLWSLRVPAQ